MPKDGHVEQETLAAATYGWLMQGQTVPMGVGSADGVLFDRHLLACLISIARAETHQPLTHALGLDRASLQALLLVMFPHALGLLSGLEGVEDSGEDAIEEEDLRDLLIEHGDGSVGLSEMLALMIARRSLASNHLWQDLGLRERAELTALMGRHFPGLAEANSSNMKWKKFFYRELCQREGVVICKSPNCEVCEDFKECFGEENGPALLVTYDSKI
ncbi:MAG: nitrogen fixation protein NifQ [Rhodospirillaceae bacterium]